MFVCCPLVPGSRPAPALEEAPFRIEFADAVVLSEFRDVVVAVLVLHRVADIGELTGPAPCLAADLAQGRRLIAEGAKADADSVVKYKLAIPNVRIRRSEGLQIECAVPTRAYLILSVRDFRRILFERRAVVRSPGEPVAS